ncbi:hypothetical protein Hesp01_58420 [Herbidospora sp. NBRC 101105]|nr:hypothetical protein Hesp01_58420 [Herbidospora sp. NBRC 101105]
MGEAYRRPLTEVLKDSRVLDRLNVAAVASVTEGGSASRAADGRILGVHIHELPQTRGLSISGARLASSIRRTRTPPEGESS